MSNAVLVVELEYVEFWETFWWLMWLSHFELELGDMNAMDAVEGRN